MILALAQFGVAPPPSFAAFLLRLERLASEAVLGGADFLVLPEYFSMVLAGATAKAPDLAAELEAVLDQAELLVSGIGQIAQRHQCHILGGTLPMRSGGHILNRAPMFGPQGGIVFQDKRHMTRFEAEEWGITGGAPPCVFETVFGRIGVSICFDAEFPLHVRAQVAAGANLILVPSCTDSLAGFNRVSISARARAIENQCFIAVCPLVGQASWSAAIDDNVGQAALFTPCDTGFPEDGVAVTGKLGATGLVFAQTDFAAIAKVRAEGAVRNHAGWEDVPPAPVVALR